MYLASYNNISNNTIYDNTGSGLFFDDSSNYNIISENTIYSNQGNGIYGSGSYNKIKKNIIYKNGFNRLIMYNGWGGIHLKGYKNPCKDNIISENIIYSNDNVGISLTPSWIDPYPGPINTKITGNIITDNKRGIALLSAKNNDISGNDIENNRNGIYLYNSSNNKIMENNFINSKRQARFVNCRINTWEGNYWGKPLNFPKIIFGRVGYLLFLIPWVNIDWRPAKEPYDI
jgi:parallel beta-helix repeat protein